MENFGISFAAARGWVVVQRCPTCGLERETSLRKWLMHQCYRRLRSFCVASGQYVWMRNTGWRRKHR